MTDNTNLGKAVGAIGMDTSGLKTATADVNNAARAWTTAFSTMGQKVDQAAKAAIKNLSEINGTIQQTQTVLKGLVFADFIKGGINAAMEVQKLNLMFKTLSGSQEAATRNMDALKRMADRTGQSFLQLAEGATSLLPVIKGSNVELDKVLSVAQRLAVLDPMQGVAGASFALREFMGGEYMSLARRFEMPRAELMKIREQAKGDPSGMIEGLSKLVDKMGLTQEKADEMGKTGMNAFKVISDEVKMTIAEAFTPFLNDVVVPLVKELSNLIRQARELNPEIVKMVGGITALAAASKAIGALPMLGGVGQFGLATAAAGFGGIQGGGLIVQGMTNAAKATGAAQDTSAFMGSSRKEIFGQFIKANGETMGVGEILGVIAESLKKAFLIIVNGILDIGENLAQKGAATKQVIDEFVRVLGEVFAHLKAAIEMGGLIISEAFNKLKLGLGTLLESFGRQYNIGAVQDLGNQMMQGSAMEILSIQGRKDALQKVLDSEIKGANWEVPQPVKDKIHDVFANLKKEVTTGLLDVLDIKDMKLPTRGATGGVSLSDAARGTAKPAAPADQFDDKQRAAWEKLQDDLDKIRQKAHDEEVAALKEHEKKKADIVKSFTDQVEQMTKDRAKWESQRGKEVDKEIKGVQTNAAKRDAEAQKDHEKRIADIKKRSQDDETQAQKQREQSTKDHLKALEDLERQHRNTLIDAASRLDAKAVYQEMQRYEERKNAAVESKNEEAKQEEERKAQRDTQLKEQLDAEDAAFKERQDQAHQQDAERIAEIRTRFEEEKTARTEADNERLAQMKEARDKELAQEDVAFEERINKIKENHVKEVKEREDKFKEEFIQLDEHLKRVQKLHKKSQEEIEKELAEWIARQKAAFRTEQTNLARQQLANVNAPDNLNLGRTRKHHSGTSSSPGGMVELLDTEAVLPPDQSAYLRQLLGSNFVERGALPAAMQQISNRNVTSHVNNTFNEVGSYTPDQLISLMESALSDALQGERAIGGVG